MVQLQKEGLLGELRQKARALVRDQRPWPKRLALAAACSFAFCFTTVFYGPLELTAYNIYDFWFTVKQVWPILAAAALVLAGVLALLLSLLRGRVYNYALCLFFGCTAGCYIQGNFLGGELGALTGDPILWERQTLAALGNFLVWAALLLAVFAVHYFSRRLWKRMIGFGCALIVLMQCAGLASMAATGLLFRSATPSSAFLSAEGLYELSEQQNILVILVDRMDACYLSEALQQDPACLDFLDGFTSYTNAISPYLRTAPGANTVLTGYTDRFYQRTREDFYEAALDGDRHLLADLAGAGYSIDLYSSREDLLWRYEPPPGLIRNYVATENALQPAGLLRALLQLSAYRYVPQVFKPSFWTYTQEIRDTAYPQLGRYELINTFFAGGLPQVRLSQQQPAFKFIHLSGSHTPYILNADGTESAAATDAVTQTRGVFRILQEYFDRLKALGVYEDAAILITADHGVYPDYTEEAPLPDKVLIGLFYKPAGAAGSPLAHSAAPVSTVNIAATVLKTAGAGDAAYGPALDDLGENDTQQRLFYRVYEANNEFYVYEIGQDANDFSGWQLIEHSPVETTSQ